MRKKVPALKLEKFALFVFVGAAALFSAGLIVVAANKDIIADSSQVLRIVASSTLTSSSIQFVPSNVTNVFSMKAVAAIPNASTTVSIFDYSSSATVFNMLDGLITYNKSLGNLGVGVGSPNTKLSVSGTVSTPAGTTDPTANLNSGASLSLNGDTANNNAFAIGTGAARNSKYDMWFQTGNNNGGGFRWYIGTAEKMTMDNLGNLMIGTTATSTTRFVVGSSASAFSIDAGNMKIGNVAMPATSTDAVNKSYVDSSFAAVPSGVGSYVTSTAAASGDNSGATTTKGYMAANNLCNAKYSGSHVCFASEMLNTIVKSGAMPSSDAWIFNGPPGYTAAANDCDARTNGSSGLGAYWQAPDGTHLYGRGLLYNCNAAAIPLACCK